MFDYIRHLRCKNNYSKVLTRIKRKKSAINVLFLVLENEKWGYQSLYELLDKDEHFNPIVLVGIHYDIHKKKNKTKYNLEENYNFFKSRGMNVDYLYKDGKYINLKKFKPDMIFYEQQWGLPKVLRPETVSKYSLTFYCPYGLSLFNYTSDYMKKFHSFLFRYFVDSDFNINRFETYQKGNSKNCTPVGYSKLDKYLEKTDIDINKYWKEPDKFRIIYSPHHSFDKYGLRMATFERNGKYILNLAQNSPNTTWVFRPHPGLKYTLLKNNIMTEEEIEKYYKEWENVGNIYTQGDYIGLFKSSNLMITDCCSFLAEYLPSGNPLIRLSRDDSTPLNPLGEKVVEGYYQVYSNEELQNTYNKIVYENNDEKKDIRLNTQKYVIDFNQTSSEKIMGELIKILDTEDVVCQK